MRRIFVAIPFSGNLQKQILEWETQWKYLPVRWLQGKNLHVTLVPPWYEKDIEKIKVCLESISGKSFPLEFSRVTFGPNPGNPRLIWAEGQAPPGLLEFKTAVEKALEIFPEERPFRLHLTLARFRPEEFKNFPSRRLEEPVAWKENVDSFVLMESHLSPGGADYEILKIYPL